MAETTAEAAARYWDANKEKIKDPTFWMAHPACRRAINRRVSGSPHEWPLDWFRRMCAPRVFDRGVSWGCGLGAFERAAIRIGLVREIDAFDVSESSLEAAKQEAAKEGIAGINYRVGNFDDPALRKRHYDIAFFQASLHHVSALERMFRRLTMALKVGGVVYVDEFVGPSRSDWTEEHLQLAQGVLDMVPQEAKLGATIGLPVELYDPSEGVRAAEIPRFLRTFLDIKEWRPYGGQVVDLVLPYVDSEWANSPEGSRYVEAMLSIEDYELRLSEDRNHHLVAYGTVKKPIGLFRPLARQAVSAVKRRLPQI